MGNERSFTGGAAAKKVNNKENATYKQNKLIDEAKRKKGRA
jgi:hypothetical protein